MSRLLFVDMVELAWISVLLVWTLQTSDPEEDEPLAALASCDATETCTSGEMRALLVSHLQYLMSHLQYLMPSTACSA